MAPSLSVTFNQAMVPVGTLDQLDLADIPVEVSPAVEGRWRSLGTRTLRLEHTSDEIDRLPAATEYSVVVPAGTESATGEALGEDFRFTFSTPAPTVESVVPGGDVIDTQPVFDAFEATTPDFLARVWIGDAYTAEHAHRGRSIDTVRTVVPMGELGGDPDLILQKAGAGRLYYRLGLRYAPSDLRLDPRDEGFVVARTYEAIDEPSDVVRNDDGSWTIAPGAMVRVRLSMVADSARTNMALVDHLPAGLEALNPALAASPRPPAEEEGEEVVPATWYGFTWFDHQSFRNDRSEAYSSYLPAGTYDHTYVARATTPGTFVVPPAKAEEIYAPEVFGRSGTDRVTVG